ncbi:hypothetical protein PDUR_07520 [Paenibacillus durus]|uniref:Uncharacterized protein n=2 Tax=Paenibacillus durus TaxID=44251 RepID=A0A089IRY9_PAEDU|nr:hypothetical protein PDUR_07520 [Paenibacillus durus]
MVSKTVSSIVDIFITGGNELDTVTLNSICGGAFDNNLEIIPDGTVVTLRRGKITRKVTIRQGEGSECVANSLRVSRALARIFRLRNQTRFTFTFNTVTKTLTMCRKRVTADTLLLTANSRMLRDRVAIGLGIARKDGNYLRGGELITLRRGNIRKRLRFVLLTENDVFNNTFSLNPRVIRLLGLEANKRYRITYDQVKREYVFIRQVARS